MLLEGLEGGTYTKEHWLFSIIHAFGLNVPPAPLSLNDTRPARTEDGLELSLTAMVNVIGFPGVNDVELGEIVVVVLSSVVLVELAAVESCAVPLLGACVPSPEYSAVIVMASGEFMAEVYDVEQAPDDMIQESGINEPPA
jgi:hypothetical protein